MSFFFTNNEQLDATNIPLEAVAILSVKDSLKQGIALISGQEKGTPSSCVLIEEQGVIVGILTERDLVRLSLLSGSIEEKTVGDVMTKPVITLEQQDFIDIFSVYTLMRRHRIRHLPIVDSQKQVVGIVTSSSLRQSLHLGYFLRFREVQEIMTQQVITATPQTSLLEVAQLMAKNRISCVIIVEEEEALRKPIGILTERDIVQAQSMELDLQTLSTETVMSRPLLCMHPKDSLAIAQKIMQEYRVRRVVVVSTEGQLEGIVTETNLSQILDPIEMFGMMEILQRRIQLLIQDRDRQLPKENFNLKKALQNKEFQLYYQPQVNIESGQLVGAEALLRWQSPERGLVSPSEFIPMAEMTGFIVILGDWVLRQACEQIIAWKNQGLPPLVVSVNVSSHQFKDEQFVSRLQGLITELHIDPCWLKLELTESSLVENIEQTLSQFQAIQQLGMAIAIDDFGTGYASLGYLQHFPFDTLKIDRCFVDNIQNNPKNAAITIAIIRMAQELNFSVIAEGVEQETEMQFLKDYHCPVIQGYLISEPLPVSDFTQFFLENITYIPH